MKMSPSTAVAIRMTHENGQSRIPIDSMIGTLNRPFANKGMRDRRTATLETLYDYFINDVPDPDTAMQQDPNFDEKLRQQPDVHACMRLRELTVASMPARVDPSKAKGLDPKIKQEVADYVDDVFNALPNRCDLYRQMQTAVLAGGQGIEFVWAEEEGIERPVEYYPVHKSRFAFDRLGNMALLTRQAPVWGEYVGANPSMIGNDTFATLTPPGKFVYHKYMAEGGPWHRPAAEGYIYWGRGEDTNLYIPVTFDQFVLRFRMKWLEKHGMPTTILEYPSSEVSVSDVRKIVESIREEAVIAIPKPPGSDPGHFYNIRFEVPPPSGNDAFERFSETWTKPRIEKIILGGANLLEVGDTGGYSATLDQRDAGASIIFRYDAKNIDETINSQLIPAIVRSRWPNLPPSYYPRHVLASKNDDNEKTRLELLQIAAALVPVREQDVYDAAGLIKPKKLESGEEEPSVFLGQKPEQPSLFDAFPPSGGGMPGEPKPEQPQPGQPPQQKKPKTGEQLSKKSMPAKFRGRV